jgi:hypothetical protein
MSIFWRVGFFPPPFFALRSVPQDFRCSIYYISDLCGKIKHSCFLRFADDTEIFHHVTRIDDCLLWQSDMNCVRYGCTADHMKLFAGKTKVISLSLAFCFQKY